MTGAEGRDNFGSWSKANHGECRLFRPTTRDPRFEHAQLRKLGYVQLPESAQMVASDEQQPADCCGCPMASPPIEVPGAFEVDELVRVEAGERVALPARFGQLPDRLQAEMVLRADPEAGETWPELLEPNDRLLNLRCVPQPGPVACQAALRALPVPFVRYDPADPEFEEAKAIPGGRLRGRFADGPLFVDVPVETWEEREGVRIWRQSLDGPAPPIPVSDVVEVCLDPVGEVRAEASGP